MDIDDLIDAVIGREGGYSNHPDDRGGATRWDVTEAVARAHGFRGDMRTFPRDEAARIYRRVYWVRPGFDRVASLAPDIATVLTLIASIALHRLVEVPARTRLGGRDSAAAREQCADVTGSPSHDRLRRPGPAGHHAQKGL